MPSRRLRWGSGCSSSCRAGGKGGGRQQGWRKWWVSVGRKAKVWERRPWTESTVLPFQGGRGREAVAAAAVGQGGVSQRGEGNGESVWAGKQRAGRVALDREYSFTLSRRQRSGGGCSGSGRRGGRQAAVAEEGDGVLVRVGMQRCGPGGRRSAGRLSRQAVQVGRQAENVRQAASRARLKCVLEATPLAAGRQRVEAS